MDRFRVKVLSVILSFTVLVQALGMSFGAGVASADEVAPPAPPAVAIDGSAGILIEASTGEVLWEFNADQLRHPASMAKMMTEYIVMKAVKAGTISLNDQVIVSKLAASIKESGSLLSEGERYTIEDMFKALSINSSNDAAFVLAEAVSGTVDQFVAEMNSQARAMGLSANAIFIDPTGLDREDLERFGYTSPIPGETLISARDAAKIAFHIINEVPEVIDYTKTITAYLRPGDETKFMENWNWMLEGWIGEKHSGTAYEGLDGLKTGFTDAAGNNFTGTAERDGFRLISVVMNTQSRTARFIETAKVLDYGFNNFEKQVAVSAKSELEQLKLVPIRKGVELTVPVVLETGLILVVNKGFTPADLNIVAETIEEEKLVAPVKTGDVLGSAQIEYNGKTYEINLIAAEDVNKAGWFRLLMRGIGNFFKDLFQGIKNLF